jgi:NADH dehydrogenase (ubiquinone) 1 alpha/beta subcomplex 1
MLVMIWLSDSHQINPDSHFTNDLGLDSLDTVEVVMAIEEVHTLDSPRYDPLPSLF